jgi:uncharacterized membrane protein
MFDETCEADPFAIPTFRRLFQTAHKAHAFTTVLARADLSVVVPIVSFEIVVNVALADLVIHEKVSVLRWAGTLLITCGVALVAFSARKGAGQQ